MKKLIVGLTGASGAVYGVRLLEVLQTVPEVETHLIVSQAARHWRWKQRTVCGKCRHWRMWYMMSVISLPVYLPALSEHWEWLSCLVR